VCRIKLSALNQIYEFEVLNFGICINAPFYFEFSVRFNARSRFVKTSAFVVACERGFDTID
jgi:hypothetical protein